MIEADEALSQSLLPVLDARLVLYRTFLTLENRVRNLAKQDPICQR